MNPAWWQIEMTVPAAMGEAVEARLQAAGAESVSFLEMGDDPVFTAGQLWESSRCQALFAQAPGREAALHALIANERWQPYQPTVQPVAEQDWVASTQAAFPARAFGRLWVAPGWAATPPGTTVLHLDPGQAFGTGAHPTTALCLRFLDTHIHGGELLTDYGCGSGILAIAALLLGAEQALGVDTDPIALGVAAENAQRNGVAGRLQLALPHAAPTPPADLLVANILAEPLISLAPLLAQQVRPQGRIALSGLLHHQEEAVRHAYAPYFALEAAEREEDWSLLSGRRTSGV